MEDNPIDREQGALEVFYWRAVARRHQAERKFIEEWMLSRLEREVFMLRAQNRELAQSHSRLRGVLRAHASTAGLGPINHARSL